MKRIVSMLLACVLLLCCVSGCGAKNNDDNNTADDLKELDVVLDWYPNALHAFMYVAMEKGYYADEGLKINIRFPSNANDAISLVAAGQADIGLYYQQDVIQARAEQNVPVKSIGAVVQAPLNIVLSLKDKNITGAKDLVGKTIGYAGTELSEALIRSIMDYVGADYSDVTLIDVGFDRDGGAQEHGDAAAPDGDGGRHVPQPDGRVLAEEHRLDAGTEPDHQGPRAGRCPR